LTGAGSEIHTRFIDIRKAVKASSLRKDLGRKLAETLYDLYLDEDFSSDFILAVNKANPELLREALDICLVKNKKVKKIQILK
jgi:hypothetical protein